MRKISVLLLALALSLAFQVGSAFAADSKLDSTVGKLLKINYKYGGTTTKGFDCSGFTGYVFDKLGIDLPRTSRDQAKEGTKVARESLRAGDLVFFDITGKGISHVGIYVGDNKFAHSSFSKGITISGMNERYWAPRYVTARRVMDADTYEKVATAPKAEALVVKPDAKPAVKPSEKPAVTPAVDTIVETIEETIVDQKTEKPVVKTFD